MLKIKIRTANIGDAKGIASVHVRTWQCAYKGQITDSYLDSLSIEKKTKSWKKSFENPKKGVFPYVAVIDENVIGWCTTGVSRDKDLADEVGELYGIYVDPDYIGKGAGSLLMNKSLNKLKKEGYKKATLWVLDTNTKTIEWYEHKGWKIEGKKKKDQIDAFVLNEVRYIIDLT